jgi:hypothetical protein
MSERISNENIAAILRAQAWERAKGELRSMFHTFYDNENFEALEHEIDQFIKHVEENGLHE